MFDNGFYGEYRHSIDDKGRLIVPAKYREQLGPVFYVTKNLWNQTGEQCLYVYPQEAFFEVRQKLRALPRGQVGTRRFLHQFFASVQDTAVDKQGRVLINGDLREQAGLERDVVLVGMDDHIEIWNSEKWDAYKDTDSSEMDDALAESLGSLGI